MASRFASILQQEYQTKGLFSGAASATGKRAREALDIRNALFSGGGIGSIMGTKIFGKGYSASATRGNSGSETTSPSLGGASNSILEDIKTNSEITAKNSMALPSMAKQMNIMQKNIAKLVRVFGEKPSSKADSFFSNAKFRENQYESQFNNKSPSRVNANGTKKEEGGEGFFSKIFGMGIANIISLILGGLLKGGLIVGFLVALGKFFTDEKFRAEVIKSVDELMKGIFGKDVWTNLAVGAGILGTAIVASKLAIAGFTIALEAAALRMRSAFGLPGLPGGAPGGAGGARGGRGGRGKYGAIAAGLGLFSAGAGITAAANMGGSGEGDSQSQDGHPIASAVGNLGMAVGTGIVGSMAVGKLNSMTAEKMGGKKINFGVNSRDIGQFRNESGRITSTRNMPLGDLLEKMKKFSDKAIQKGWVSRIFARVVRKLGIGVALRVSAFLAGLAAAPFSAGLSAIISAALAAWTIVDLYTLYDLLFGSGNLEKELEDEDAKAANAKSPTLENNTNKTSISGQEASPAGTTSTSTAPAGSVKRFGETGGGAATGIPNRTPSAMGSQDSSRKQIEAYLGKAISDEQYDALLKAVGAEAGQDPMERAAVASVILNRAKKLGGSGEDIMKVLNAPYQFQAITGPDGKSGDANNPWSPNARRIVPGIEKQIAANIALVPKGLDSFTSANPGAYGAVGGRAKFDKKMAEMSAHGGQTIGQSVFANMGVSSTQVAGTKINGGAIASASSETSAQEVSLSNADLQKVMAFGQGGGGQSGPGFGGGLSGGSNTTRASPFPSDFYENLIRKHALT
jgi:hypothetical protein